MPRPYSPPEPEPKTIKQGNRAYDIIMIFLILTFVFIVFYGAYKDSSNNKEKTKTCQHQKEISLH